MLEAPQDQNDKPLTALTKTQRRVLGVLIEKGLTTPDQYPLTLKATTTGCNQKNNRDPLANYNEDTVETALDELRELGLVAVVHTESGRTERYRHWMRRRFPTLPEAQLAILCELLLRGQQTLGDLRSRASRMVPLDTLDQLRSELQGLIELHWVQTTGPLDRRGVEVDHNLYPAAENHSMTRTADSDDEPTPHAAARPVSTSSSSSSSAAGTAQLEARITQLEALLRQEQETQRTLRDDLSNVQSLLVKLGQEIQQLKHALGE